MRKILLIGAGLIFAATCQAQSAELGMCWYAGGNIWVPLHAAINAQSMTYSPMSVALYGSNGINYYALSCDESGNLSVSASAITGQVPIANGGTGAYGVACLGLTDDTVAVNSSIAAACAAGGGRVLIPAGTCLINPHTTNLNLCSGLEIEGQGRGVSILKVGDHVGAWDTVFGIYGTSYSYTTFKDFTLDYNTANNQQATIPHGQLAIGAGAGGTNMTWDNVEFRDVDAINVIFSGTPYTTVRNSLIKLNTSGAVNHDFSALYIAGNHAVIEGNYFLGGINANGAVTAIELHGGNQTITGNVIDGFEIGMNITGVASTDSETVTVTGNSLDNIGIGGIDLWSYSFGSHTTGYGLANVAVTGNAIRVKQTAWTSYTGGVAFGIGVNSDSNLPLKTINIADNNIEFDLESNPSGPYNYTNETGIGYWDSTGTNTVSTVKIQGNTIKNSPGPGIVWSVNGDDVSITNNVIENPGSSSNTSFPAQYRAGIFINPPLVIPNLVINGNMITDNNATTRMRYGTYSFNSLNTPYIGNVVNVTGATTTVFQNAYSFSSNTQAPLIQGTVNVPLGTDTPAQTVAYGSFINSIQAGHWYWANQAGTAWADPNLATVARVNQANTYSTGMQDFSAASMKQPPTYMVGANTITNPTSAGTLALTSQIPLVAPTAPYAECFTPGLGSYPYTTPPVNTSGAKAVIVTAGFYAPNAPSGIAVTDNLSGASFIAPSGGLNIDARNFSVNQILYELSPATTGTSATFTIGAAGFPANVLFGQLCVVPILNVTGSYDGNAKGSNTGTTTCSPGSITPGAGNHMVIVSMASQGAALAIPGYIVAGKDTYNTGVNIQSGAAYAATNSITNPQFTGGATAVACTILSVN